MERENEPGFAQRLSEVRREDLARGDCGKTLKTFLEKAVPFSMDASLGAVHILGVRVEFGSFQLYIS